MPTPRSSSATAAANGSAAASRVARSSAASCSRRRLRGRECCCRRLGGVEPAREGLELLAGCGGTLEQVVVVGRAEPAAGVGDPLEIAFDLLDAIRLRLERSEEAAQVGAELAQPQLDVTKLLARAGQLRREPFERRERTLGGRGECSSAVSVVGRQRLGRPLCSLGELGEVTKPLSLGAERLLPSGLEALRRLGERGQLSQTLFLRRGPTRQLLVAFPGDAELAPRKPRLAATPQLLVTAVGVEHVELVRRPGEPPLLELAGHRDQPLGGGREVLARDGPAPRVGARAPVREHPPRDHQAWLVLRRELGESGELFVLEESFRQVELGFDVGFAGGGPDRPGITLRAE